MFVVALAVLLLSVMKNDDRDEVGAQDHFHYIAGFRLFPLRFSFFKEMVQMVLQRHFAPGLGECPRIIT